LIFVEQIAFEILSVLRESGLENEVTEHILVCNPFERRLEEHDVSHSESDGEMDFDVEEPFVCEEFSDDECSYHQMEG
jgi:hypothetical protein